MFYALKYRAVSIMGGGSNEIKKYFFKLPH
jgi:hypothetical protein